MWVNKRKISGSSKCDCSLFGRIFPVLLKKDFGSNRVTFLQRLSFSVTWTPCGYQHVLNPCSQMKMTTALSQSWKYISPLKLYPFDGHVQQLWTCSAVMAGTQHRWHLSGLSITHYSFCLQILLKENLNLSTRISLDLHISLWIY